MGSNIPTLPLTLTAPAMLEIRHVTSSLKVMGLHLMLFLSYFFNIVFLLFSYYPIFLYIISLLICHELILFEEN